MKVIFHLKKLTKGSKPYKNYIKNLINDMKLLNKELSTLRKDGASVNIKGNANELYEKVQLIQGILEQMGETKAVGESQQQFSKDSKTIAENALKKKKLKLIKLSMFLTPIKKNFQKNNKLPVRQD